MTTIKVTQSREPIEIVLNAAEMAELAAHVLRGNTREEDIPAVGAMLDRVAVELLALLDVMQRDALLAEAKEAAK